MLRVVVKTNKQGFFYRKKEILLIFALIFIPFFYLAPNVNADVPTDFYIYSPDDWISDITPDVIGCFYVSGCGINTATVEFAYSLTGSSDPINWAAVDGVYENSACTNDAEDGDTGYFYAKVSSVPFNQESGMLNTIRFRAEDMCSLLGTQVIASVIKIDITKPNFTINTPSGNTYKYVPTIDVDFEDKYSLDDAYYQIDSFLPSGTDNTGWEAIFQNLDGNSFTDNFQVPMVLWNSLVDGIHTIYFKVWDDAGNFNDTSALSWQFTKNITQPPSNFSLTSTAVNPDIDGNFYLNWNAANGADNYSIRVHNSTITDVNFTITELEGNYTELSYEITDLKDGTYFYVIIAYNKYGINYSNPICIVVEVKSKEIKDEEDFLPLISGFPFFILMIGLFFGVIFVIKFRKFIYQ